MDGVDIVYSPDIALTLMADRIALLERDNAVLRAAVQHYQETQNQNQVPPPVPPFSMVPYSESGGGVMTSG